MSKILRNKGRFIKGHPGFNHKPNSGSFKKGEQRGYKYPKGNIPWNKGKSNGYINTHGYLVFWKEGKEYLAHRLIWEKYYGTIPEGYLIHHKDRNKLNNDISNLELIDRASHSREHYEEKRDKFRRRKRK